MKRFLLAVLPVIALLLCCCQRESVWKGSIESVDGVTVVRNPKEPMFGPEVVKLQEIMSIGDEEGDEERMFWASPEVWTDDDLNIYIGDGAAARLSKFDAEGNFLWAAGRKGQGPGEFETIRDIIVDSQNHEVLVLDNNHIDVFSLDGRYTRSIQLKRGIISIDIFESGALLILPLFGGAHPLIYDKKGNFVREFAPLYTFEPPGLPPGGGFAPERAYQVFGKKVVFSLPDTYEIREYDLNGTVHRTIKKDQKLNSYNIKRQNGVISSISIRDWSGPCFLWGEGFLINRIMTRADGPTSRDWVLDIFDPAGRFLCSYPLPEVRKLDHIDRDGQLYFVKRLPYPGVIKCWLEIKNGQDMGH